ncbi:VOC family protein [Ideonella sp. 4Y16]|uniref:VOC family protein n=1 Tax=Ideonella alba TaxID=2824118 RepID=A0A940Y743_9BURK|nr:VOC family protein [Ideonella alba]MBQ0929470.1 VOC family protein [Ideonella alba]MBQ0944572.1 VOC family protein [Ideonella alba]
MITLEHANLTVRDLDRTLHFILTALPHWRVRGEGTMDWSGRRIRWLHVGDEQQYLALQSQGDGEALDWQGHAVGVKHLGFIVPDVEAVVARLQAAGWPLDHWGGSSAVRRSAYLVDEGSVQFEFVEYRSDRLAERLEYA